MYLYDRALTAWPYRLIVRLHGGIVSEKLLEGGCQAKEQGKPFLAEPHQSKMDCHACAPKAALHAEQARMLYSAMPAALAGNALVALLLIALQQNVLTWGAIVTWLALLAGILSVRAGLTIAYRRYQGNGARSTLWLNLFRVTVALTGLVWGAASLLLFPADSAPYQVMLAFAIAGVTAGAVTTLSADLTSALCYIVPALVPLIVRLFWTDGDIPITMGAMVSAYLGFLVLSARASYRNVCENICLRFEAALREKELRDSETLLFRAQEVAQTGSWKLDVRHNKFIVSPQVYRIWGLAQDVEITCDLFYSYVHPDDKESFDAAWAAARQGVPLDLEHRIVVDGKTRWIRARARIEYNQERQPQIGIGTIQDITERKQVDEALRIAAIAFESREGMIVTDAAGRIERVNQAFVRLTGFSAEEVVGRTPALLSSGRHDAVFYERMWATLQEQKYWQGEVWNTRKNGKVYADWVTISAVTATDGTITHYVGIFSDISSNPEASAEIHRLAYYDPLTQLPNRRLLLDRLGQALAASERSNHYGALLFLDLDNFKTLNDTRGHDVGDLLLVKIAQRLAANVREGDTVARLGGDEFVLMLENLSKDINEAAIQASHIGEKVRQAIAIPYMLEDSEYSCTTSIGIRLYNHRDTSVDDLIKHADLAMYQVKKEGRNGVCFFEAKMQAAVEKRSAIERDLRNALQHQELSLLFQLQVDSEDRAIGAEALLRWKHPERGEISPEQFIPLAEETGLIVPIGTWVIQKACAQLQAWANNPITCRLQLAVNVSSWQLRQSDFVEQVKQILESSDIDPALLKIELTESMVVDNLSETVAKMQALKALGVGFSLDDFGTAYSSLTYLKQLPVDQLKLDKSFVRDLETNENDAAIVRAILVMGHTFGLKVFAEGVETRSQMAFLQQHGCHAFQGYLFSKPVTSAEFDKILVNYS